MSDAIKEFVDKEERDAISELAKHQIQKTQVSFKCTHWACDGVRIAIRMLLDSDNFFCNIQTHLSWTQK